MGEVYRADDLRLHQQVALKFLPRDLLGDPDRLARLHQEVRIARQISHQLICRVHDIAEVDGEAFLTMEFIDGEDLGSLAQAHRPAAGGQGNPKLPASCVRAWLPSTKRASSTAT